jgi:hypothetical protein
MFLAAIHFIKLFQLLADNRKQSIPFYDFDENVKFLLAFADNLMLL